MCRKQEWTTIQIFRFTINPRHFKEDLKLESNNQSEDDMVEISSHTSYDTFNTVDIALH